jgi:TRAP-type C4-dicarboxylate transport system permease small subunit
MLTQLVATVGKKVQRILENVVSTLLVAEFLLIAHRIIARRIQGVRTFPDEIAIFCLVWMLYLGAAYLVSLGLEEGHLRIDLFDMLIKNEKWQLAYHLLLLLVCLTFVSMFLYSSTFMIRASRIRVTTTLHLPYIYWYMAPFVSSVLMFLFLVPQIALTAHKLVSLSINRKQ